MSNAEPMHPAALEPEVLARQCDVERLRRSGPGGQHRNKVETAVRLHHRPTGVRAEAGERRSQAENRKVALFRLRLNLAMEVRSESEAGRETSTLWRSRCRGGNVRVGASHEDFPAVLAEALDTLAARRFDVAAAAKTLGCTTSQLVKLLKKEPRALPWVNRQREEIGLGRFV